MDTEKNIHLDTKIDIENPASLLKNDVKPTPDEAFIEFNPMFRWVIKICMVLLGTFGMTMGIWSCITITFKSFISGLFLM